MKRFVSKARLAFILACAVWITALGAPVSAAEGLRIFTSNTSLALPPGETISYSIELINDTDAIRSADLSFDDGGNGWTYQLTSSGRDIRQVAVKPHETATVNLSLTVPLQVDKGNYTFAVKAGEFGTLPLNIAVTEQGSYKSELTASQPNMQGNADSSFSFSLELANRTASKQQYALSAETPPGWNASFSSGGTSVTSVEVEAGGTSTVTLNLKPSDSAQANAYKIPVRAEGGSTSADTEVEAVITGTYGLSLSTSDERLSTDITAGGQRKLELVVRNTGSAELKDVSLTSQAPANWEVSFEPKTIASLQAGQSAPVTATIKSSDKSLAGDYVLGLSAQTVEKTASATLRVTVKTSVLWGWIGVLIVAAVVAAIFWLFRKYGRR